MPKEETSKIAVIDAETDPFLKGRVPKPFLWGFYDGEIYLEFAKTEDLIAHISEFEGIIYAHNGGKFDFHFLLNYINRNEPIMLINGRLVKCNIGKAQLRDSYALLPAPLSAYAKDTIDYNIFEERVRNKPQNWKMICDYLRADCVYLYNFVQAFISKYGMHLTQAGAAMKQWEEIDGEKAPQSNGKYFEEFSKFYFGGRVEVFKAGHVKGPLKLYDINSAYPWAMLSDHPYKTTYRERRNPELTWCKNTSFMVVDCISRGALPFRKGTGGIYFPNDEIKRRFYTIGHEFFTALALGLVSDYTIVTAYNFAFETNFQKYIKPFYQLRLDAKQKVKDIQAGKLDESLDHWKAQDLFAKLLMNSLYGKFGANPENYGHYLLANDDYSLDDYPKYEEYARFADIPVLRAPLAEQEMRYYNAATAASITSQVRSLLLRTMVRSNGVVYCDTDSLLCAEFKGETGSELGQWKHEYDIKEAWIAGKKLYAMRKEKPDKDGAYKIACKGVKLDAKEIKAMCAGETILYKPSAPTFSMKKAPVFTNRSVKMLDDVKTLV